MEKELQEETHTQKIVKGCIKKELIGRLSNHSKVFPLYNKNSLKHVRYYVLNIRRKMDDKELSPMQKSVLYFAGRYHTKESARIRKAFRTIAKNVLLHVGDPKDVDILRITQFAQMQWLLNEFFISKEKIVDILKGFSIFYPPLLHIFADEDKVKREKNVSLAKQKRKAKQ